MNRERWLIGYCVAAGALGWLWLLTTDIGPLAWQPVILFLVLALLVESAGFRLPPSDPYSLVGIVALTAAVVLGLPQAALIVSLSALVFGVIQPWVFRLPRNIYHVAARPFLRSGVRSIAILSAGLLSPWFERLFSTQVALFMALLITYPLIIQLGRIVREYVQNGQSGVGAWWRSSWRAVVNAEVLPLPIAWLGIGLYQDLGLSYFLLGSGALLASSLAVRRAAFNLYRQRRSMRELSRLNEVSRAIIRVEMDVTALCDLIYREASKVVDTSSFHLGLFAPDSDEYTLFVRVQDRVRQPALTLEVPRGDGIIGWMRETGQALLVDDFTVEMNRLPARPRYQSEHPPRSGVYVPLSVGDAVIGSISIQSYQPHTFDVDDLRMLSLIADQSAVAISKARVFDQAQQRAVQLQVIREVSEQITAILDLEQLLPSVVRLIREHFGYHPVHIFTMEPDQRLVFRASTAEGRALEQLRQMKLSVGVGVIGTAAASDEAVLINDVTQDPRYISDDLNTRAELAVPLRFGNICLGVLDLQSAEINRFSDSDLFVLRTLGDQIAVALESARAFTAQREEAWTLNALLQVAENLARATTLDELLPTTVRLPALFLGCERCYCLVWDAQQFHFTPVAAYGLSLQQRSAFVGHTIDEYQAPLLAEARRTGTMITLPNATPSRMICAPILEPFGGSALLVLPLVARGTTLGLMVVDYDDPSTLFSDRTQTLSISIANQVAAALESALLAQEAAEAAHMEEELRVARDIQTALLPAQLPVLDGWQVAADWRSARLVGGDFYDFWYLPRRQLNTLEVASAAQHPTGGLPVQEVVDPLSSPALTVEPLPLGFVIADVSDKGVPAAMFMSLSRSLVRAAALDGSPPHVALARANRWIVRDSDSSMFVTIFYGVLDLPQGRLRYTCAGHNPPLLIRADGQTIVELMTPGMALGVLEDAHLDETEITIEEGDVLVCYTDGITEAINAAEEPFGVPRLMQTVVANRERSAEEISRIITDSLLAFTGDRRPFDDVTLVVLKREKASGS
ncbi:MAG: GAF domain-containing protein [Chloroflexi bacterium AL-W]|nr:GAF domain-containing protein [Chloroflexi bacterium AL-N1]NOK66079.1 GAF domain-containing protein [Chloroflexi bacterium AL-N10]NOK72960.1 GAF domain-containing protein [Chloroflexi bacterium AL-N5]NOK79857.1 GAF domain-containing protein [Chloroflexi bacterium AL-W]NOK88287.1 GAF domain-containing protein [Chloroflexi bacterium AL-N15]